MCAVPDPQVAADGDGNHQRPRRNREPLSTIRSSVCDLPDTAIKRRCDPIWASETQHKTVVSTECWTQRSGSVMKSHGGRTRVVNGRFEFLRADHMRIEQTGTL